MNGLPQSRILTNALEAHEGEPHSAERDQIRASLAQVRGSAGALAAQIRVDFPGFTAHDQSHTDSLWRLVDLIAAPDLELTPTEAWTLGVAILLHDLGLPVAAYPGGRAELREAVGWPDARAAALRRKLGRPPSAEELAVSDSELDRIADQVLLRQRHAERAAELVDARWGEGHALIDDSGLRASLGPTAGRVAASHWWQSEQLLELGFRQGAPGDMPSGWTVRPILLGALLRIADAAHIDESRAPTRERAFRELDETARLHWDFQGRLRQPVIEGDRIRFVSSADFGPDQAEAWWLCFDQLRMLDEELAGVDAVLQAESEPRLAARSVEGARDPRQLASLVVPAGWEPIDARIELSDATKMIRRFGGRALYGRAKAVPIRELIQNSSDAVRARSLLQDRHQGWIEVRVDNGVRELTVTDNGVGMGVGVLTGALIDFGRSLWESEELASFLPGLQDRGFQPTGTFGIGFFSVFMWAKEVTVKSRSLRDGPDGTRVLSFPGGIAARPLLKPAELAEQMLEPGTSITLRLEDEDEELHNILDPPDRDGERSGNPSPERLRKLVGWLAPALDVELRAALDDESAVAVVAPGDWLTMPAEDLLARIEGDPSGREASALSERVRFVGPEESPTGRGALASGAFDAFRSFGVLVAGGLRVDNVPNFAGLLFAEAVDAARSSGSPDATAVDVSAWATEQARLVEETDKTLEIRTAEFVLGLGGNSGQLALADSADGSLSPQRLQAWARDRDRIFVIDSESVVERERERRWIPDDFELSLADDVLDLPAKSWRVDRLILRGNDSSSLRDVVKEIVATAWETEPGEIEEWHVDDRMDAVDEVTEGELQADGLEWVRPGCEPSG